MACCIPTNEKLRLMADIDITRKITHRLLAELHVVVSELLRLEDYTGVARLLELREQYEKIILAA